jgi:hypothetical protein
MQTHFHFFNKEFALTIHGSADADGEFRKCQAVVSFNGQDHPGVFKLTKSAWDLANEKAQGQKRPLEDILTEGGIAVLKAELYIRTIPNGFAYVVDHRYFEDLWGLDVRNP